MTLFVVRKKFSDGTRDLNPGDVVDLEGRNVEKLEALRFVTRAEADTVAAPPKKFKSAKAAE